MAKAGRGVFPSSGSPSWNRFELWRHAGIVDARAFPVTDTCHGSLGVALDTTIGKTVSYLHEDDRLLQGPNRPAGRVPADGPYRSGAGVQRQACRSWRLSPRPASGSAERGRHCMAARLSAEGLLRSDRESTRLNST